MFPSSYIDAILLDRNIYQLHYIKFDDSCKMRQFKAAMAWIFIIAAVDVCHHYTSEQDSGAW